MPSTGKPSFLFFTDSTANKKFVNKKLILHKSVVKQEIDFAQVLVRVSLDRLFYLDSDISVLEEIQSQIKSHDMAYLYIASVKTSSDCHH